eukprot:TRINITY_DN25638_c0_g1_i2.p1 TRINITY_DN25638_c0_g1~~TRINITY_DN25638_c0_g1_i2.p1  ORF type:complete len:185 (+),score=35.51 TRINITY_DN25638_c0_g1_i2:133-687(+)
MIRRPPRSTLSSSSAASDVYKRQVHEIECLRRGGNMKFAMFMERWWHPESQDYDIATKYNSAVAQVYSQLHKDPGSDAHDGTIRAMLQAAASESVSPQGAAVLTASKAPTEWVKDEDARQCQVCGNKFSFLNRRHHCRRCGRVVCAACAPQGNSRPILEWNMKDPVRHCRECFKSPSINWEELE